MKISKIEKAILFIIAVFAVSLICATMNISANNNSAYELGKLTAMYFAKFFRFIALAGLMVIAFSDIKRRIAIKG